MTPVSVSTGLERNNHILPSALTEMRRIVVKGKLPIYSH